MYGAMIGDIVGSKYEFNNIKTKGFPLFSEGCAIADDSVMTVAVASAILKKPGRAVSQRKTDIPQYSGRGDAALWQALPSSAGRIRRALRAVAAE